MSIFFDIKVGPNGRRFRRAVDADKYDIELIIHNNYTEQLFGNIDIGKLIEMSTLSICMINIKMEVIGFMALCDHPNVKGVDPSDWEIWIRNLFQKFYLSRNTLFIHFMCCIDAVADIFIEEAFISIFRNDVYLLNIVLVVPAGCPEGWMSRYKTFTKRSIYKFKPKINNNSDKLMFLYTAIRNDFCPKLKIRRAVEEDNDDIVKILGKNCPRLQEMYGDFYISEIIGRHPGIDRKIIVADYQDQAVGVLCVNSKINYDMLQNTYELGPFHGLQKATALEKEKYKRSNTLLKTFGDPIMLGQWSPFHELQPEISESNKQVPSIKKGPSKRTKTHSKVNFDRKSAMRKSFDHFYYKKQSSEDYSERELNSPTPSITTNLSFVNYLLDDDPFDYEIVNIDNSLFTVPEVPSSDILVQNQIQNQEPQHSHPMKIQDRVNRRTSILKNKNNTSKKLQSYDGDPNAFIIELFGFRDDVDETQAFHLLEAAFEMMKDYDYCIIRVPCKDKSFHLLEHFCFVPTKAETTTEYALYVAHRNSVLSKLRVRKAELMDIPQIAQLLSSLDGKETLWTVENTIMYKNELQCFVFLSGVTLIGIGILEQPEQINFIRTKFNLDSHRIHKYYTSLGLECGLATLKAVLVYPVFETHYRFFARDMMRLSGSYAIMWLTAYRNKWVTHKANSLAVTMIPLMPRNSEIAYSSTPELRRIRNLSNTVMAFSSWCISKKSTSLPKVNVNARILVVGASRTAMAFLNTLLFSDSCSYLFFTNVTLVSPNGLPYSRKTNALSEMMFQKYHTNSDKYLKSVPYTYYVNIVQGTMVEINKRNKYILLSNGQKCDYDLLFLLFGKQYQHPDYLKSIYKRKKDLRSGKLPQYIRLDIPQPIIEPDAITYTPANVFIINTITDANKALGYVRTLKCQETDYKILVYGATKHAYCCLATLIEMKIPTENICFIEPFPSLNFRKTRVSIFCNTYVDKTVCELLENLNIKVYRSYYFHCWYLDKENLITRVDFLSQFHMLQLKSSALFYYGTRGVNEQAFFAINKSGMAYDGGILIDHQFRTKDHSIYAAGPATRYYRRYYAETKRQKYYDAYEVGAKLGSQIRDLLDPLFRETSKDSQNNGKCSNNIVSSDSPSNITTEYLDDLETADSKTSSQSWEMEYYRKISTFKKPHVTQFILPGGLQYLEVRSPGMKIPHHYVQSLHYSGIVMETYKNGYFKLRMTKDLIVDGITCLTPEKIPLENFKNLYGLSSSVLNNVYLRYTVKKLDNFFHFFQEPWACFLYHDQADELFAVIKEILPKGQKQGETLAEIMRTAGDSLSDQSIKFNSKVKIRSSFEKSPHVEAVTDYVLEWLSENDVLLPMYFQPWQTTQYNYDLDRNPAFRKRKNTIVKMLSKIF